MRMPQFSFKTSVMMLVAITVGTGLALTAHLYLLLWQAEAHAAELVEGVVETRLAGHMDMMHDAVLADVRLAQLAGAQATEAQRQDITAQLAEHVKEMRASAQELQRTVTHAKPQGALLSTLVDVETYIELSGDAVRAALTEGTVDEALLALHLDEFRRLERSMASLSQGLETQVQHSTDEQQQFYRRAGLYSLASLATLMVVLVAAAGLFVRQSLARLGADPAELGHIARRIADGDLGASFKRPPPPGSVGGEMCRMADKLAMAVQGIRGEAASLSAASQQIAAHNAELAGRYDEQTTALSASAATMESLGLTVAQNAEGALRAAEMATAASKVAQAGGAAVAQVVDTMGGISRAAQRIGDITGVIDTMAFQTNILALNAAVEAARAGEAGRGFSVVAAEVRCLAQRSAEAAREIRQLTGETLETVRCGADQVGRAGDTVQSVVEAIQAVTRTVSEISESSFLQTDGVQRLSMDVGRLQQSTESNAAMVEESAAATASLSEQAWRMLTLADGFGAREVWQRTAPVAPSASLSVPMSPEPKPAATLRSEAGASPAQAEPTGSASASACGVEFF